MLRNRLVHPKDAGEYAVHERDLTFNVADQFAGWWSTSGWIFHREIPEGFANWFAGTLPPAVDDDEG
jgi:hypothetical protein